VYPIVYHPSTTFFFWRMAVLEVGGNRLCILFRIFIFFVCINVLHRTYFITPYTYALYSPSCLNDIFIICMCLGGALLQDSFLFVCNNSMCFVIIEKGEIVGPKAICPNFDDNKTCEVMFSNISFKQVSGFLVVAFGFIDKTHNVLEP